MSTSIFQSAPGALVISIINNKGGVGKTTSTCILAQLLAYLGKRVLVIDMDPQCNASVMLGEFVEESEDIIRSLCPPIRLHIADLFTHRFRTENEVHTIIVSTKISGIDIIPGGKRHDNTVTNLLLNQTGNNSIILKKALASIKKEYDFIILDNGPAKDILSVNSLFASDIVYVPVRVESFSHMGLRETLDSILYIKDEYDIDTISFGGAFITQAESNTTAFRESVEEYTKSLGGKFFQTAIRKDTKIGEIEKSFRPILEYCPNTNAVFDYSRLLLEMQILDDAAAKRLQISISA